LSRRDKNNACQKLSLLYCRAATIMPPLRPQPYHPDCRAALTLIVALQFLKIRFESQLSRMYCQMFSIVLS
jgi:hypothetical protein